MGGIYRIDRHYSHAGGMDTQTEWRVASCGNLNLCCGLGATRTEVTEISAEQGMRMLRDDIARVSTTAEEIVAALNRSVRAHGRDELNPHQPTLRRCEACTTGQCTGNPDCPCGCDLS